MVHLKIVIPYSFLASLWMDYGNVICGIFSNCQRGAVKQGKVLHEPCHGKTVSCQHMNNNKNLYMFMQSYQHIFVYCLAYIIYELRHKKPKVFAFAKTKTQISFAVTAKLISAFVFAT